MSVAGILLVIDDSELVLERVKARLQRESYEVTTTSSPNVEIFSTFVDREILQSGWLLGEGVLAKKAAALTVAHGDGRVGSERSDG